MGHPEAAYLGLDDPLGVHLEAQLDHPAGVREVLHDGVDAQFQTSHDQKLGPFQEEAYPLVEEVVVAHLHQSPFPPFLVEEEAYPPL